MSKPLLRRSARLRSAWVPPEPFDPTGMTNMEAMAEYAARYGLNALQEADWVLPEPDSEPDIAEVDTIETPQTAPPTSEPPSPVEVSRPAEALAPPPSAPEQPKAWWEEYARWRPREESDDDDSHVGKVKVDYDSTAEFWAELDDD